MPAPLDVTGEEYGKLTAVAYLRSEKRKRIWQFRCECGNIIERRLADVRRGDRKTIRSCGCDAAWFKKGHDRHNTLPYGEASFRSLYARYRATARIRNIVFDLHIETFRKLTKQRCVYCGKEPKMTADQNGCYGEYLYNGLDRVDNSGPYTRNNVVPCCGTCNLAKREMSVDDFLGWIGRVYQHRLA